MELLPYEEMMEEIRSRRIELGLSQNELAQRAGISGPLLSRMENRKVKARYEAVYNVVEALQAEAARETAADVMNSPIRWAEPDDTHADIAAILRVHAYSQIPVREDGELVGAITSEALASNDDTDQPIGELMIDPFEDGLFAKVPHDIERDELEEHIQGRRALLVTDDDGEYVGIITHEDLL